MVGEPKKESNNRSRYYWSPWDDNDDEGSNDAGFRIQADVDNNRLLLWANEDEYKEVTSLLQELGAIASDRGSNPNKWRILDARTPEETAEMLEKLQQTWGGRNPLNINIAPREEEAPAEPVDAQPTAQPEEPKDKLTRSSGSNSSESSGALPLVGRVGEGGSATESVAIVRLKSQRALFQLVAQNTESSQDATEAEQASAPTISPAEDPPNADAPAATNAEDPPPINITVTPDGRMVISSDDVAALDQLEDLLAELEPPKRDFEIFELKNSRASAVVVNLEEYFADQIADDDAFSSWYWGEEESESQATLGKSRKLRFIWDSDTNSIVVQNASEAQLEVIRELIRIYDQPVSEDAIAKRRTDIVPIRYSSAEDIATAIKEVYRDLLSSKDKEFEGGRNGEERDRGRDRSWSFFGGSSSQKSAPMKMSFEGALSIGVDEISNSLIISADDTIWENIRDLAVSLDEKARPDTVVQIHQLSGSLDAEELQDSLEDILSSPWQGNKPTQSQNNRGGGDRGRSDRDRDRRRDYDRDRGDRDRDRDRDRD
jgi:Bacterial type II/III secretion system short domain